MNDAARTDWSLCGHLAAPGPARPLLPIIAPVMLEAGFFPVRIRMTGEAGKMTLQIMAEDDSGALRIEDCETISHALSAVLDVENPISGAYALEISSPGLARPLTRPVDFERWAGYEAKLEVTQAIDGQRRFRGTLDGYLDDEARLETLLDGFDTPQILGFALGQISEARLVPDEADLTASLRAGKGRSKGNSGKTGKSSKGRAATPRNA